MMHFTAHLPASGLEERQCLQQVLSDFANAIERIYKQGAKPSVTANTSESGSILLCTPMGSHEHLSMDISHAFASGDEFYVELANSIERLCEPYVGQEDGWNLFIISDDDPITMRVGVVVGVQTCETVTSSVSVQIGSGDVKVETVTEEDDDTIDHGDIDWALMASHGAEPMQVTPDNLNDFAYVLSMSGHPDFKWGLLEGEEQVIVAGTPGNEVALIVQPERTVPEFPEINRKPIDVVSYGGRLDRTRKRADHGLDADPADGVAARVPTVRAIRQQNPTSMPEDKSVNPDGSFPGEEIHLKFKQIYQDDTGHFDPSIDGGDA